MNIAAVLQLTTLGHTTLYVAVIHTDDRDDDCDDDVPQPAAQKTISH